MTELTTGLQRGSELAGYRIEALLGRGGFHKSAILGPRHVGS